MSIYWDVLSAAYDKVAAIESIVTAGIPVDRYKKPEWDGIRHKVIQVLVTPREDLALQLADDGESFERGCEVIAQVFVGLIYDDRYDDNLLQARFGIMEDVFDALWNLAVIRGVNKGFDVDYDPSGAGAKRDTTGLRDELWWRFDFTVSANRTSQEGG